MSDIILYIGILMIKAQACFSLSSAILSLSQRNTLKSLELCLHELSLCTSFILSWLFFSSPQGCHTILLFWLLYIFLPSTFVESCHRWCSLNWHRSVYLGYCSSSSLAVKTVSLTKGKADSRHSLVRTPVGFLCLQDKLQISNPLAGVEEITVNATPLLKLWRWGLCKSDGVQWAVGSGQSLTGLYSFEGLAEIVCREEG